MENVYMIEFGYGEYTDYREHIVFVDTNLESALRVFDAMVDTTRITFNALFDQYTARGEQPERMIRDRTQFIGLVEDAFNDRVDHANITMVAMPFMKVTGESRVIVKRETVLTNRYDLDFMENPEYNQELLEEELRERVEEELRQLKGWD